MLANWVSQSITNADALTTLNLGAVTSADWVTLAQRISAGQLAVGDMLHYQIKDGNNRESGICSIASSTSVTINTIFEQNVSGVLTINPASHMTLSGSAVFELDAGSGSLTGAFSNAYTTSTADIPDNFAAYTNTGGWAVANQLYLIPAEIRHKRQFSRITTWVATADAAATNTRFGALKSGPTGSPIGGTLIFDSGDQSARMGTTGQKTISLGKTITLDPGMYYFLSTSGSTVLRSWGCGASSFLGGFGGINYYNNNRRSVPYLAGVTGALPASITSLSGVVNTDCPIFGMLP